MAWKVVWTESAWQDLEGIASFIAKDSPHYARAVMQEARDASRSLTLLAERGHIVPEFGDRAIRELFIFNYRLIYKVHSETVSILALVHGARDLFQLLKKGK